MILRIVRLDEVANRNPGRRGLRSSPYCFASVGVNDCRLQRKTYRTYGMVGAVPLARWIGTPASIRQNRIIKKL
jgi:hypothetical protein